MSPWTHCLCLACYTILEPGRVPARVVNDEEEGRVLKGDLYT